MPIQFPNLEWGLSQRRSLLSQLVTISPISYLTNVDGLIARLRHHNCRRIRRKLKEAGSLSQFDSIVSELRIGEILASRGMLVTFLSPTRAQIKTADMLVKWDRDV